MTARIVGADSSEWHSSLNSMPHDVYHVPSYLNFSARLASGVAKCFIHEGRAGRFTVPFIVRAVNDHWSDATSPYGYPGPLCDSDDPQFITEAGEAFRRSLSDAGIVTAFIRFHPILSQPALMENLAPVERHGETVYIDLERSSAETWAETRENHRRDISKARRQGLITRVDPEWSSLDDFKRAYRETMERVEARAYYLFSDSYFDELRRSLGDSLHLLVVERQGRFLAGAIFTERSGMVQYHLGGTMSNALAGAPMKALFHFAIEWFKKRGNHILHLGGGVGSTHDSVFLFKAGFGSGRATFATWRIVANPEAYELLVRQSESSGSAPRGFFPAYRTI